MEKREKVGEREIQNVWREKTRYVTMASPEVERPLTSPSHAPATAGISPGRRPTPASLNKKVTFGERCLDTNISSKHRSKSGGHSKQRRTGGASASSGEERDENDEFRKVKKRPSFPPPIVKKASRSNPDVGRPVRKRSYSFSEGKKGFI